MMSEKVYKNCPFCGCDDDDKKSSIFENWDPYGIEKAGSRVFIKCLSCGARGPSSRNVSDAHINWNSWFDQEAIDAVAKIDSLAIDAVAKMEGMK